MTITSNVFNTTRKGGTVSDLASPIAVADGGTGATALVNALQVYHGVQSIGAVSFNNSEKVLNIGSTTVYWYKGVKVTTAALTCDLDLDADRDHATASLTTNTLYYFYFKDATGKLYWSPTAWDLKEVVPVATVFWNGTAGAIHKEWHNHTRDLDWHINAHLTIGARYLSGLDLTKPTTALDANLDLTAGYIYDEDLPFVIANQTTARAWYKASAGAYTFADIALPYTGTSGDCSYLNTGTYTLTSATASKYVCYWVYGSGDIDRPIYIIPTHAAAPYNTVALARAETVPSLSGFGLNPELKLLYRFIYRGDGEFQEAADYRLSSSLPIGSVPSVAAASVTFAPAGNVAATNVQAAIEELDTEKVGFTLGAGETLDVSAGTLTLADNQIPGAKVAAATETSEGAVELATDAETVAGSATDRATTPANITARLLNPGIVGDQDTPASEFNSELINNVPAWYGVAWDEVNDTYIRTGAAAGQSMTTALPDYVATVHGAIRACILSDAGVRQYYLHHLNKAYKEDGVTASVLTGADGQVMSEFKKCWYRYYKIGNVHHWEVSPVAISGFDVHPAFYKNGAYVDCRYMGCYEGVLYDMSASAYQNGIRIEAHTVGFTSATKTLTFLAGGILTINMTGANAGTGYTQGDTLTITTGTVNGTATVATVGGSGEVLTVTLVTKGYGYTTGVKATTGGTGANCTINIATIATALTNPYTNLVAGDKVVIGGSVSNNGIFTVVTGGNTSFTVGEAVADEAYASSVTMTSDMNFTATTGDKLSSIAGFAPAIYGTRANFRAAAKNRGTGWRQQDNDLTHLLQVLALIDYASFYFQSKIGAGLTNVTNWPTYNDLNPVAKGGNANSIGNATGNTGGSTSAATESTKYLTYRGIENPFGHLWKWVDGLNINSNRAYVSNDDTVFADDTSTNYTDIGINAINADGYQNTLIASGRVFLPASVGAPGASNSKITDYYYQSSGWRVAFLGGDLSHGAHAGLLCCNLCHVASLRSRLIAARLVF